MAMASMASQKVFSVLFRTKSLVGTRFHSLVRTASPIVSNANQYCSIRCFSSKEQERQLVNDAISKLGGKSLKSSSFVLEQPKGLSESKIEEYLAMSDEELATLPGAVLSQLGSEFVTGSVVLPDSTQAVFFWELAKSNGDINASYSLAVATYRGEGIEADKTSAINQLEELVEQNHAHAKYSLAKALLDSDDRTPELEKRALDLYESAAKGGVIRALNNVGNMYASGVGTAQDDITARKWYEAAAEMADPLSMFTLGTWCNTGRGGKEVDFESGFKWNELAAMGGMPKAQFNLGFHFMMGQGTDKDVGKAIEWFKMAAAKGVPAACVNLGEIYRRGLGSNKVGIEKHDFKRARHWHERGAAAGSQVSIDILNHEKCFVFPLDESDEMPLTVLPEDEK